MEAAEAKIQRVLEGNRQFLIPHFQRPYSWRDEQWKALWRDLVELVEDPESKPHFLGPIVSAPARSVPEGVEKRLLIDGQQRLTTILILLALIRDRAREQGNTKLADRIQDLIVNRHEEGHDHYKLLPTQGEDAADSDRDAFIRLVNGSEKRPSQSGISAAYDFFASRLRKREAPDIEVLQRSIANKLTLVSIILDEKDNPYRIFESLNGKGRPLSQADLIRNYFFMRLHEREHERAYVDLWRPMQRRLGEDALTDFVRHYLMRTGTMIRETDVYAALKETVESDTSRPPLEHLKQLTQYSQYYEVLLHPERAPSPSVGDRLKRLNRLELTVAYPFLLELYAEYSGGRRPESELLAILELLENYIIRRFIAGVPTYGLNKIFPPLYSQAASEPNFVEAVKRILASKGCPRDEEFRERLSATRLYGSGDRRDKTRFILECLESALGHKERVDTSNMSIEHVMPQTLTETWKAELGETWEEDHEELLHTLGNLTLTSYNPELSNSPFAEKKKRFATSHVELNRYFEKIDRWTGKEIERRAEALTEIALSIWPYFGPAGVEEADEEDGPTMRGTVPTMVRIRDKVMPVQSWVDVAMVTMNAIAEIGAEEFQRVAAEMPRLISFDTGTFRRTSRPRRLANGAYVAVNQSSSAIHRMCIQATELAGLGPEDWQVHYEILQSDAGDEQLRDTARLQLEFWTQLRPALEATGKFASLREPRPKHYYSIALGRTGAHLSLNALPWEERVSVKLVLSGDAGAAFADMLVKDREEIEAAVGAPLSWNVSPEKRQKNIRLDHRVRLIDRASWADASDWLRKTAMLFRDVFVPRIMSGP